MLIERHRVCASKVTSAPVSQRVFIPYCLLLGQTFARGCRACEGDATECSMVCIEVDLMKDLPNRVWIAFGDRIGFWQELIPENLPRYYGHCLHQGHSVDECRVNNPELKEELPRQYRREMEQTARSKVGLASVRPGER